jgi:hypothetical protein
VIEAFHACILITSPHEWPDEAPLVTWRGDARGYHSTDSWVPEFKCCSLGQGTMGPMIVAVTPQATEPILIEPVRDHLDPNIPETLPMAKARLHGVNKGPV